MLMELKVNILVTPSRRACLMDFGLAALAASQITTSTPYAHLGGTLPWQSPEIINHDTGNSREGDMYAFASVCYEVQCHSSGYEAFSLTLISRFSLEKHPSVRLQIFPNSKS